MVRPQNKTLDKIECPKCGTPIPISEALQHQLTEQIRGELEEGVNQQEKALLIREKQLKDKEKELKNQEKEVEQRVKKEVSSALEKERDDFELKEKELKKRELELSSAKKNLDQEVKKQLQQERVRIEQEAKRKAKEDVSVELRDVQAQLEEKNEKLEEAAKKELSFRKRERELEDSKKNLELEVARKLATEKGKIEEEVTKRVTEEKRLKDLEKDKQIKDMLWQIEDLKRKAEQGSQQLQGEVQELDIEDTLTQQFPSDEIKPVPKGVRGADVLQRVFTKGGSSCGSILWESKRTKNWIEGWVGKLKDDQREAKADLAVLVTDMLPKDVKNFGQHNGVWVTNYESFLGLALALRAILTQVAFTKLAAESKDEKIEILFKYLTGPEFRQRVEAMVETFVEMRQTIDKEKRAAISRWSRQEKQIEKVIAITAGMHGDLRGLIGSSMQSIPALESGEDEIVSTEDGDPQEKTIEIPFDQEDEEVDVKDIPF